MVKLKRLKIRQYRNVEPCELVFGDRFNVVLGANGAGKTTLLKLVSKVLRESPADANDPLAIDVTLEFDGGTLTGAIDYDAEQKGASRSARAPTFDLRLDPGSPDRVIRLRQTDDKILVDPGGGETSWTSARGLDPWERLLPGLVSFMRNNTAFDDVHLLGFDDDVKSAFRFDEFIDTFRELTARTDENATNESDLQPYLICSRATNSVLDIIHAGFVPSSIVNLVKTQFPEGATEITFDSNNLRFLSDTVRMLGLRSATARLELTEKSVEKGSDTKIWIFGNLKFWFTRRDGSIFQGRHLSYGQKRLLAFLYYLDANPSFVIADELVNGLHHVWIEECMKAIGDRQAFLTSQNPLLLDYLYFESALEVKQTFILCRAEPDGDRERMIWRNMTDDEADMFYSAYKVGVEHVGEILRTRGFW